MKAAEVKIGATYVAKVSGKLTKVRIDGQQVSYASTTGAKGGWRATNLETGRSVHIATAARLRFRVLVGSELEAKRAQDHEDRGAIQPSLVSTTTLLWNARLNVAKRGARLLLEVQA